MDLAWIQLADGFSAGEEMRWHTFSLLAHASVLTFCGSVCVFVCAPAVGSSKADIKIKENILRNPFYEPATFGSLEKETTACLKHSSINKDSVQFLLFKSHFTSNVCLPSLPFNNNFIT